MVDAESHQAQQYIFRVVVGIDRFNVLSIFALDERGEQATDEWWLGVSRSGDIAERPPLDELAKIVAATDPYEETAEVVPFEVYKQIKDGYRDARST